MIIVYYIILCYIKLYCSILYIFVFSLTCFCYYFYRISFLVSWLDLRICRRAHNIFETLELAFFPAWPHLLLVALNLAETGPWAVPKHDLCIVKASFEPSQTSKLGFFCENSLRLKAITVCLKYEKDKEWLLNTSLHFCILCNFKGVFLI